MEEELHRRDHIGVQDFVLLEDFTNPDAFIENLQKRFHEDLIYVSHLVSFCMSSGLGCLISEVP